MIESSVVMRSTGTLDASGVTRGHAVLVNRGAVRKTPSGPAQ